MEIVLGTCAFIFGALIGSFLNVVILRYGFHEAPRARSGCAACGGQLRWFELVPIVSFVFLRGRCAKCGSAVSLQYPLVELTLAGLFLGSFLLAYPFSSTLLIVQFALLLVFWSAFVLLTAYDIRHTLVPFPFALTLMVSAALVRISESLFLGNFFSLYDAFWGAVLFGGILFFLFIITRGKGMGFGDVYVGVALGFLFGLVRSFEVITLAFWIGAAIGISLLILKKGVKMKSEVPFVPFLFIATVIGLFTAFSPLAFIAALTASL